MSEEFRKASCAGKETFSSPQDATKAKRNQRNRHKATLDVYRCAFCEQFHLGAPMPRIKKKMRAVR